MTEIGIIGAGLLGATLARKIAATGHGVTVANSRSPETLSDLAGSGVAVGWANEVAVNAEVLFLVLPYSALTGVARMLAESGPLEALVVDVGNYYPGRDGALLGLTGPNPAPDTVWTSEQFERPMYKAFNSITFQSLNKLGLEKGSPNRIGLPVAGPDGEGKQRVCSLVDEAGFDPVDGGSLAQSWRQQPGSPVYCTDLPGVDVARLLDKATEGDAKTYRANRAKYDDETAVGYEHIRSLRKQGKTLDQIAEQMTEESDQVMSKVHKSQKK
ncbi:NADPH-dependent F420 reductase [Mycobacteroides chelonae]|uniref:NADPH-dependent F420 reductase n=1 Tax=Mycobacteroides chelonae TaxID=1774 RepID=UPI0008A93610|nr:NAD(P)-binding domain-containing protein [Mycobacteroides chelonae]OHU63611.1 NADP oxidoreductase [Mycobacteroides chelonae]